MPACDLCHTPEDEVYAIDSFGVCGTCLRSGRIAELPIFRPVSELEQQFQTGSIHSNGKPHSATTP